MGGAIEWAALPTVCELLGIAAVESLVDGLVTIRTYHQHKSYGKQ